MIILNSQEKMMCVSLRVKSFVEAYFKKMETLSLLPFYFSSFYSAQISYGPGGQNERRLLEDYVFN